LQLIAILNNHLKVVRVAFEYNRIKYDQFLKLLKYLRAGRIDIRGTVATVKELLKGHADLILGFNTSMPTGSLFFHCNSIFLFAIYDNI